MHRGSLYAKSVTTTGQQKAHKEAERAALVAGEGAVYRVYTTETHQPRLAGRNQWPGNARTAIIIAPNDKGAGCAPSILVVVLTPPSLAELEVLRQAETREARAAWHQAREHAAQEDAALATMDLVIETLAAACLSAAGYHRHHQGTWRKRRGTTENPPRTA